MPKKEPYTLPEWMEKYRPFLTNSYSLKGETVEKSINYARRGFGMNIDPKKLSALITQDQLSFLEKLRAEGLLKEDQEPVQE